MTVSNPDAAPSGSDLSGVESEPLAALAEDTAPKKRRGRPPGSKNKPAEGGTLDRPPSTAGKPAKEKQMIEKVTGLYSTVGLFVGMFSTEDAKLILSTSTERATEVVNVARHHTAMWNALETLTTGGDYVPLVVGHTSLALAIMANHGITLESLVGKGKKPAPTPEPEWQQSTGWVPVSNANGNASQ